MADRIVKTIPATVNLFTKSPVNSSSRRKVAAYARVSTDMKEQLTSYRAQIDYYTSYIKQRDDWEFAGVYTDEGITATSIKRRDGFKRMIEDALAGKIDLIITKSVSRFARNTVDSLTAIRSLKENGTECYFEKENIWTFDGKGEMLLTIMSSIAQEEARSISENCTWGQRKRFADGKVSVPFKSFLGYDRGLDGNLTVNKEQAKIVRRIYGKYIQGYSLYAIAKMLMSDGVLSPAGKKEWYISSVKSILTNEKYKGDALLQKTYTSDFLTKKKKRNSGEVPQYYVKNNHEAIIERDVFDMVQETIGKARRGSGIFSGKIKCGECGGKFGSKIWHCNDKYRRVIWQCENRYSSENKCQSAHIDEQGIRKAFVLAVNELNKDKENIILDLEEIKNEFCEKKAEAEAFIDRIREQSGMLDEFDEDLWLGAVEYITVNGRNSIAVTFRNGKNYGG